MDGGQAKDYPQGAESSSGGKGGLIVDSFYLSESTHAETGLVFQQFPIGIKLLFENPSGVKGFCLGVEWGYHPDFVASNVVQFDFNCHQPVFFVDTTKDVTIGMRVFQRAGLANNEIGNVGYLVDLIKKLIRREHEVSE
ncbi:hypothetical protein PCASD_02930 [Puccinia coronata f. sp. avenae]|uniref:Uncharacterized protein n=1 Tax=Puccinia coronata f. sp. avenae TaxID=200324 RepID=A0A2N5VED1_9BASI|nr:hypothetical protein PCASD_02930 [Puccinia coronata f. sp. avenae]